LIIAKANDNDLTNLLSRFWTKRNNGYVEMSIGRKSVCEMYKFYCKLFPTVLSKVRKGLNNK